ncbi:Isochorismatase hydrolase [Aspergillus uvarum CBS 121591]|uniref:Isochorismatase hydrolase n=1 Tax=Aspergillus uvarum CBS 121591 TaxID=1448315 RepID=A0A319CBV5_9EURO|nr:Isochorismatase hydrolase [Aspergillus uvarum CBS 121591]PYH81251.1 Isochorismatase hydrolase [Aspergillus uvarum CBS 121591]
MADLSKTALVLVDPYNDFLHQDGKLTPLLKDLEEKGTVKHIEEAVATARLHRIPVYYGLHQHWTPSAFQEWRHMTPNNVKQENIKFFEANTFGAQIYQGLEPDPNNGDVVVSRHWNSDSFQNTDLDFQLRQREMIHLVLAGLTANTCLEATARHAFELGYHVTLLKDATAGWSKELTDAATELVWPLFAEVKTVEEWVESVKAKRKA